MCIYKTLQYVLTMLVGLELTFKVFQIPKCYVYKVNSSTVLRKVTISFKLLSLIVLKYILKRLSGVGGNKPLGNYNYNLKNILTSKPLKPSIQT